MGFSKQWIEDPKMNLIDAYKAEKSYKKISKYFQLGISTVQKCQGKICEDWDNFPMLQ